MSDVDETPTTDTSEAATRFARGPSRMIAVLTATVLTAGAIAYVAGRAGDSSRPLPKLGLTAGAGGGATSISEDSGVRSSLAIKANYHYAVAGTLPDLASRAPVSRLVWPRVDASTVQSWAKTLNVGGTEPVDEGAARGWTVTGLNGMLNVGQNASMGYFNYQSGHFTGGSGSSPGAEPSPDASKGSASGSATSPDPGIDPGTVVPFAPITSDGGPSTVSEPPLPQDLPSAADARTQGEQLLRDLGVLDGAWEFEVRDGGSVGIASSSVCTPQESCPPPTTQTALTSRAVVAHRVIEGRRVDGLEWTVDIGDHGSVTSVSGTLAKVEAVGDYPLRPTSAALDDLRSGSGSGFPVPLGAPEERSAIDVPECGPAVDCTTPVPDCPDTCPAREVKITITDATLGSQLWFGSEPTQPTAYLVPMYRFKGHDDTGAEWSSDVLALEDGQLAPPTAPATPEPSPVPARATPTTSAPDIQPEPTAGTSINVGESVATRLDLNFHCGVSETSFNGGWWDAVTPWPGSGGASPHIDDLDGHLTLERPDFARWTNGSGVELQFVPHVGIHVARGCA